MGASFAGNAATLAACREIGWLAGKVELFNYASRMRSDLFGFADVAAIVPGREGTTYIQATAGGHGQDRIRKIMRLDAARAVLEAGNSVEVWSWRLYKDSEGMYRDAARWGIAFDRLLGQTHVGFRVEDLPSFNELYNEVIGGETKKTDGEVWGRTDMKEANAT